MKQSVVGIILMLVLIGLACNLPSQISSPQASISGRHAYLLVAPPGSTPTATPFQPLPPTPTYIPTAFPVEATPTVPASTPVPEVQNSPEVQASAEVQISSEVQVSDDQFTSDVQFTDGEGRSWEDYPGPSVWPDVEIPAPVGILSHPEGQVNILLLGSDQRPNDGGFRTDTIQLLTINPQAGTVKLTAFPRDLYVYIPGYTVQRINTAFGWGGFDALAATMEYNFGVKPDYYVLINLWSFVDVVDSIGGVNVEIGRDLCDHRDDWGEFCVSQGEMWMNGEVALWYVRSRYTTSDLDRGRRQQEILKALFTEIISLNGLQRAPELYDIYQQNVTTNLSFDVLSNLIPIASHLAQTREIGNYSIGAGQVYNWTNYSGAMVLVPIRESVLEVMRQVISEP